MRAHSLTMFHRRHPHDIDPDRLARNLFVGTIAYVLAVVIAIAVLISAY